MDRAMTEVSERDGAAWRGPVAVVALLAIALATFFAVSLVFDDSASGPDLTGQIIVEDDVISVWSESELGIVDLRSVVRTYGTGASIVGVESDGEGGFVAGITLSSPDDTSTDGWIVHVPSGGEPTVVLEDHPGGVHGLLGVWDGIAVFEEAVPDLIDDVQRVGISRVPLDGSAEPERITTASPFRASMGASRVLVLEDMPCTELVSYDLAADERIVLEPFPEDPGCWQATWVPDLRISEDGSQAVYLRFFKEVMEATIAPIDEPGTIDLFPAEGLFSIDEVLASDVQAAVERTSFDASVADTLVVERTDRTE